MAKNKTFRMSRNEQCMTMIYWVLTTLTAEDREPSTSGNNLTLCPESSQLTSDVT